MKAGLTIGGLAPTAQLNPRTIRYYEGLGLLPRPQRSESGYRPYSSQDIGRLRLIKRARLLGLSLAEIKDIVAYAMDGRCAGLHRHLLSLLTAKMGEVDHRVAATAFSSVVATPPSNLTGWVSGKAGALGI